MGFCVCTMDVETPWAEKVINKDCNFKWNCWGGMQKCIFLSLLWRLQYNLTKFATQVKVREACIYMYIVFGSRISVPDSRQTQCNAATVLCYVICSSFAAHRLKRFPRNSPSSSQCQHRPTKPLNRERERKRKTATAKKQYTVRSSVRVDARIQRSAVVTYSAEEKKAASWKWSKSLERHSAMSASVVTGICFQAEETPFSSSCRPSSVLSLHPRSRSRGRPLHKCTYILMPVMMLVNHVMTS